jgi:hypothetical protein
MRQLLIIVLAFCILFTACSMPALASVFSVSGQVTDADGRPLPGANVTLIDQNYNNLSVRTTNDNGGFDFVNVNGTTSTITVRVSYFDGKNTYVNPSYYYRWYPANGIQLINTSETRLESYRMPASTITVVPTPLAPRPQELQEAQQYNVHVLGLAIILGLLGLGGLYLLLKNEL